ncbi:MAG: hypothetical protein E6Q58_03755 [Niabella sp.]|nr:MAG: hypothetical protein E6Q58_03755 [Niabella sp.]
MSRNLLNSKEPKLIVIFAAILLAFKVYFSQILMLDSDEIMWSVMAREMLSFNRFYLFFTTQNFTGAQESYVMLIPMFLGGVNVFVLRFGPAFWTTCSTVLIYLTFRNKLGQRIVVSTWAAIFYNLLLA